MENYAILMILDRSASKAIGSTFTFSAVRGSSASPGDVLANFHEPQGQSSDTAQCAEIANNVAVSLPFMTSLRAARVKKRLMGRGVFQSDKTCQASKADFQIQVYSASLRRYA
jgi:hypothetical protein